MTDTATRDRSGNRDVISLFSGAMGLDIGLGQAGLNLRICQDVDASCAGTIRANGHAAICGDIREIQPARILEGAGLRRGEPFLVCGGPPCQPFSTAGKRKGMGDPSGSLFMDFVRMLDGIRPRFFIMENVRGLLSMTAPGGRPALDMVLEAFGGLGYRTVHGLLDAVNYGVPQFRERFVLMGSRDGEDIFLPLPTHFQTHQSPGSRWVTLREAIGDLEDEPGDFVNFSPGRLGLLRHVPEGGNWRKLPPGLVEGAMGGAYLSGGGKVGFFRRLSYDEPCPTLVTSPVQKSSMLCHPRKDRPLSVPEYARLQQFPASWRFCGPVSNRYRQIGNAVPVGLGRALGEVLVAVADGRATIRTKRSRGTDVHNRIQESIRLGAGRALAR
jgi:DNA (cytosine-5)-methyltransferase 1